MTSSHSPKFQPPSPSPRLTPIEEILERWRIDDEWWRKEISRMYYRVALADGRLLVIFQDLVEGGWYLQAVASPLQKGEPVAVLTPHAPTADAVAGATEAPTPIREGVA